MKEALAGEPITIYGEGLQTRSFCYVDDMIDAFIRLMNSPEDVTGPINLGNRHELSMLDIAKRIVALTGSSSELIFKPLPLDDPYHRRRHFPRARCARLAPGDVARRRITAHRAIFSAVNQLMPQLGSRAAGSENALMHRA
jgi:UDP-glucuronate decarboxylase